MISRTALIVAFAAAPFVVNADVPPPDKAPPSPLDQSATPLDQPAVPETVVPGVKELMEPAAPADPREALANALVKRNGTNELPGGQAHVVIADGFAFLDEADAKKLLTEIWGNPPEVAEGVLGAIVPANVSVTAPESWAAILTYDNDGHVADDDAASINYDDLLKQMQTDTEQENEERAKAGYDPITVVGWAQQPSYDKTEHKLHWAKHLRFGKGGDTLNYAVRALGRTGVLQVNVVADMKQLPDINKQIPSLLKMVSFNEGHRYADYQEGDPVAAYGIAALIAGGVVAKAGLFKGLLALLAASWKFVAIGVAAIGAAVWRFVGALFGRKPPTDPSA